jgi:enoyl-CoA hydratase
VTEGIAVTVDDRVAVVTIDRPEVRNALSGDVLAALANAVLDFDRDPRVGALVLTGRDPAFCAGFDLRMLSTSPAGTSSPGSAGADDQVPSSQRGLLPEHRIPVVGAVNGPAVTGGLELALGCDFLVASERASFADTHARVGAMPGAGLTIRLPQLVGIDRARRMSMTGDFVDARRAYEWGLITEVVPHEELLPRARALAEAIASIPAEYVREVRRMYDEIGGLAGRTAWRREYELARQWMAERFDRERLASEREGIVERGRNQA